MHYKHNVLALLLLLISFCLKYFNLSSVTIIFLRVFILVFCMFYKQTHILSFYFS